jgi:hypothetical protein
MLTLLTSFWRNCFGLQLVLHVDFAGATTCFNGANKWVHFFSMQLPSFKSSYTSTTALPHFSHHLLLTVNLYFSLSDLIRILNGLHPAVCCVVMQMYFRAVYTGIFSLITLMWTLMYSHYLHYLFPCDATCFDLSWGHHQAYNNTTYSSWIVLNINMNPYCVYRIFLKA